MVLPPLHKLVGERPPPGRVVQSINAIVHKDPLSYIVYGFYWCILFVFTTPIAVIVLQFQIVKRILNYFIIRCQDCFIPKENNNNVEKAIVVTGCDRGFGKEIAFNAATNLGYTVFAGCYNVQNLLDNAPVPDRVIPVQMDVTNNEQVQDVVQKVQQWIINNNNNASNTENNNNDKTLGQKNNKKRILHALINNAGCGTTKLIDWSTMEDFKNTMEVNYFGLIRCCKAFLPIFKEQAILQTDNTTMRILNITSMAGFIPGNLSASHYCASKCAANSFSSALRQELKSFHIQVCTICPSFHETHLVDTMEESLNQVWNNLDKQTKDEYGEEYFKQLRFTSTQMPQMSKWKSDVVIEKVLKLLTVRNLPKEILLGIDARFFGPILRIVPAWCSDRILGVIHPTARPVALLHEKGKKK